MIIQRGSSHSLTYSQKGFKTMCEDLPTLTQKQNAFLQRYFTNGNNASEAYRYAYNTNAEASTVWKEASNLLHNPNVTLWIEYHNKNIKENAKNEMLYTVQDCMNEIKESQLMAVESRDKFGNPNISAFQKGIELKGKLFGLFKENLDITAGAVVQMGEIKAGETPLEFNIGTSKQDEFIEETEQNNNGIDTSCDAEHSTEDVADDNGV